MTRCILILVCCLLKIASPPFAFATVYLVDFEELDGVLLTEGAEFSSVELHNGVGVGFRTEGYSGDELIVIPPFIAQVGDPRVAFQSSRFSDEPRVWGGASYTAGGVNSLTEGLRRTFDYLIDFSTPVSNVSLDLYDFRGDGPHSVAIPGVDSVELQVFGEDGQMLGVASHVLPENRPIEGNVVFLGVEVGGVSSARLHFNGIEGGTSIDNVRFELLDGASRGDFDEDSQLDALDIDQLSSVVSNGTNAIRFDVTGDAMVDNADRDAWVSVLKGTFYGDADFNGTVNAIDL